MARWLPRAEGVDPNEHLGRRKFSDQQLAGAQDQVRSVGLIELTHFEETRDSEWSLDRLGQSSVDGRVVRYLRPRSDLAATKFKPAKTFEGWYVLRARVLTAPPKGAGLRVEPSPIPATGEADESNLEHNIFHAHAVKPTNLEPLMMALFLKHLFTCYGNFSAVPASKRSASEETGAKPPENAPGASTPRLPHGDD
jgi:hypothetical protein